MRLQHRSLKENQIHINKKREAHSSLASLPKAPENCLTCRNEQLRTSRRYDISNPYTHYTYGADTPLANEHNTGCIDTTYPTHFFIALFLTGLKVFSGLLVVKTKA